MIRWAVNSAIRRFGKEENNEAFPTEDLQDVARGIVQRAFKKQRKNAPSLETIDALAPLAFALIKGSGLFVKKPKDAARMIAEDYTFLDWCPVAVALVQIVIKHLPKNIGVDPMGVEVHAWSLAAEPYRLIEDLATFMLRDNSKAVGVMQPWVDRIYGQASKIKDAEPDLAGKHDDAWPEWKGKTPKDLLMELFRFTPFRDMLCVWLRITIPDVALHCHGHGLAASGAGKTSFNEAVFPSFIGKKGIVVFDMKGGMAERLMRCCGPEAADYILHLDAANQEMRPVFNIVQPPIGSSRDKVADVIQFILSGLDVDLTDLQFAALEMFAKMLVTIEGATMMTLINLVKSRDFAERYMDGFPDDVRSWFSSQYDTNKMKEAREGIERKLWKIAGNDLLKNFLCGTKNTLDIEQLLNKKACIVVTIDAAVFGQYIGLVCRTLIAAIAAGMWRRPLPTPRELPDWAIYLDEYKLAVGPRKDGLIGDILSQGRERRIWLWITHQQFSGQMSSDIQGAVISNSDVKFFCNGDPVDAGKLAPKMGCRVDDMMGLPKGNDKSKIAPYGYGNFILWVNGYIQHATRARVKLVPLETRKKLPAAAYRELLLLHREHWTEINGDELPVIEGVVLTPESKPMPSNVVPLLSDERDRDRHMPWMGGSKPE